MKIFKLITILLLISVSGCNTFGGFGRDMSEAGKAIDEAAGWSQDQINDATEETPAGGDEFGSNSSDQVFQ